MAGPIRREGRGLKGERGSTEEACVLRYRTLSIRSSL